LVARQNLRAGLRRKRHQDNHPNHRAITFHVFVPSKLLFRFVLLISAHLAPDSTIHQGRAPGHELVGPLSSFDRNIRIVPIA